MKKIPDFIFVILFSSVFCLNLKAQPANIPVKSEGNRGKEVAAIADYITRNRAQIMQEGLRLYNARRHTAAANLYNKILTVNPNDADAITMRTLNTTGRAKRSFF